jgi:hypothetical protein
LPRDKEPLRFCSTRAKFARGSSFCRARQQGVDFARQINKHCLAWQQRAIDAQLESLLALPNINNT